MKTDPRLPRWLRSAALGLALVFVAGCPSKTDDAEGSAAPPPTYTGACGDCVSAFEQTMNNYGRSAQSLAKGVGAECVKDPRSATFEQVCAVMNDDLPGFARAIALGTPVEMCRSVKICE